MHRETDHRDMDTAESEMAFQAAAAATMPVYQGECKEAPAAYSALGAEAGRPCKASRARCWAAT